MVAVKGDVEAMAVADGDEAGPQEAIGDSELAQLLFDQVPCFISVQDRGLTIIEYNTLFQRQFGEALGRKCYQAYKKRDDPCPECPVVKAFEDDQIHISEEVVVDNEGRSVNMLVHAAPIRKNGRTVAVMEMSTNISEVRRLQTHLASLGQAIAGISHSIKGILTGLQGGVYVVNSGLARDQQERVEQGWSIVQRNVERISRLALDILYYSKDRRPEKETLDLDHLVHEMAQLFEQKFLSKGIAFSCEFSPLGAPLGSISADPSALHTLLVNLLENALDACLMDGRADREHLVVFGGRRRGHRVALWVSDTGVGMDTEARQHLFDPTFSTKGSSGTGLGLMLAHKVATEHGGTIEAASAPGQGATFTVVLPTRVPPSAAETP